MRRDPLYRAAIQASYYDEDEIDQEVLLWIYGYFNIENNSCDIGFSYDQLMDALSKTNLTKQEKDSVLNYIEDNYSTPYEEWYFGGASVLDQYSGLNDKKGNHIFENDIVLINNCKHQVIFEEGRYIIRGTIYDKDEMYVNPCLYQFNDKCVVVSNIYNNK